MCWLSEFPRNQAIYVACSCNLLALRNFIRMNNFFFWEGEKEIGLHYWELRKCSAYAFDVETEC